MIDSNILAIALSYSFGIFISLIISKKIFHDIFPYYKMEIINDKKWVESMEMFFKLTKREMILTTLTFSSLDIYKRVELALDDALLKGRKIFIIGANEKMGEEKYNKLLKKGCKVVRISQKILDEDNRFWHHIVIVDSKHWLWIRPHESGKRDVHYGYFKLYDIDQAKKLREKIVQLETYEDIT